MVNLHFAIAITRTCGSGGGSYIAKKLAELYGIDLYDRKLLRLAAEDSGINEEIFAKADENTRKTLLYQVSRRVYDGSMIPPESGNFISDENLFNYQAKVLRELLNQESYVCVGRAADYVLRDMKCLDVFVCAPLEWRRQLVAERSKLSSEEAEKLIQKKDKARESWYNFFTFGHWGVASNYDLCLDSSILGLEGSADFIIEFARREGLL